MRSSLILPNFTLSAAAKLATAGLRDEMTTSDPDDPLVTAMVAWGEFHGRPAVGKLGESVIVSFYPQSMSAQIAQLVETGLVSKEPNPADARASLVTLTDAGRADLAEVRERISHLIAERLESSHRTEADLEAAVAVLRDLVEGDSPTA